MKHKRIILSVVGILMISILGIMAWQVTPVSAGFTPTTPPTSTATSTVTPTAILPLATATATSTPPPVIRTATLSATNISPSNTPKTLVGTPGMPVTGGDFGGNETFSGATVIFLAADLILIIVAINMVIRQILHSRSIK